MSADAVPFQNLSPGAVLAAVESTGLLSDGRLFALNSYENRVYRVGLEEALPVDGGPVPGVVPDAVVVKFYRPGRWTTAQIQEEHDFARQLVDAELPVAAPVFRDGVSLQEHAGYRFALFACRKGAAPELDAPGARALLGRTMGRLHAIAATRPFRHRENILSSRYGERSRRAILASPLLPEALRDAYEQASAQLVAAIRAGFQSQEDVRFQRLHGDCHLGNILWDATGPVFVDLDDCIQGPTVQDLWMFLSGGDADGQRAEWAQLLEGYEQFANFDFREVALIEPLRALRIMNHAAWLAARWDDPAFPRAFPWFAEPRYWGQHIADLREQCQVLADPPLLRSC